MARYVTSITQSPSPSTVNTQRSPGAIENVGITLPVMTTIPALRSRLRSASRLASQASVANGLSDWPSPICLSVQRLASGDAEIASGLTAFGGADHTPPFQQFSTIIEIALRLGIDRIAVLDQLIGRHRAGNERDYALGGPRRLCGGHILSELERNFALDAQVDEVAL